MLLKLEGISKNYHGTQVLKDVSLEIKSGEFFTILGPTGAGKTTLLRIIAGLEKPDKGKIYLNGKDITHLPPVKRKVSLVFQTFALYPTMTVYENIALPLKNLGFPEDEIKRRVKDVTELLGISHLLNRSVLEISGGEAQRTAFARALAKDFSILLLDEPLTNVDYKIRERMIVEMKKMYYTLLEKGRESIWIFATPDSREALSLSTRVAILYKGEVLQYGPVLEVYKNPKNIIVASYMSYPWINRLNAKVNMQGSGCYLSIDNEVTIDTSGQKEFLKNYNECIIGIRPASIKLYEEATQSSIAMKGLCELIEIAGSDTLLHFKVGNQKVVALVRQRLPFEFEGKEMEFYVEPEDVFIFSLDGKFITRLSEG
jgi:ABC-type sugar transport system ATPase subunit